MGWNINPVPSRLHCTTCGSTVTSALRSARTNNPRRLRLGLTSPLTDSSCLTSSFQAKEGRSSLKRRLDGRLSRAASSEKEPGGESESKKESDENKENWRLDEYLSDQDSWNESVISGEFSDSNLSESSLIWSPRCCHGGGSFSCVISADVCFQRQHDGEIFKQPRCRDAASFSGPPTSAPLGLNLHHSDVGQVLPAERFKKKKKNQNQTGHSRRSRHRARG